MGRKIITVFLTIAVLFIVLMFPKGLRQAEEFKKLNNLLTALNASSVSVNDLSEIKWRYWELYVEPRLEDDITEGIDRIIKNRIDKIIELSVRGKKYPPMDMYIVTHIDPESYQCKVEGGYADDSMHLPEFPETYDPISYNESDLFLVNLDNNFRFVVEPHIYSGHSLEILRAKNWNNDRFNLPSKLSHTVLFSIIEEKNATRRKYKVCWVLNYDKQASNFFSSPIEAMLLI
ncbi:MAG: hypothetical protein FD145_901 [Candidatus Saganbacteria bacterium]|uniref:Uncharacterized protein n=1 Tax=Candidatus Saganbacteria bacterium TaxID=2575572 RepID=A0A833NX04_UNCSA|nr:MAG: hypothetical protein FD145_901 [Candidatus Saganbacteria bacterium]